MDFMSLKDFSNPIDPIYGPTTKQHCPWAQPAVYFPKKLGGKTQPLMFPSTAPKQRWTMGDKAHQTNCTPGYIRQIKWERIPSPWKAGGMWSVFSTPSTRCLLQASWNDNITLAEHWVLENAPNLCWSIGKAVPTEPLPAHTLSR